MNIRPEVWPFVLAVLIVFAALFIVLRKRTAKKPRHLIALCLFALVCVAYFMYFFRDPERVAPANNNVVVAGADGKVAAIKEVYEDKYLKTDCVRISIFLSLFDVHVNRAPIAGTSKFLGYFPGKRLFTFQEKSSEVNQHNKILIEGIETRCLICQIVGPVCRRVVYWPDPENEIEIEMGERIGMMKFGSRLDMYLPKEDVRVIARIGERVRAGETVVAEIVQREETED